MTWRPRPSPLFERPEDSDGRTIAIAWNDNHATHEPEEVVRQRLLKQTGKTLEELMAQQVDLGRNADEKPENNVPPALYD